VLPVSPVVNVLSKMKPLTFSVLRLLSDGHFRSGEDIAQTLGVSRASVWNALQAAEEAGLEIYRVRGRGYCLQQPIEWLEQERILEILGDKAACFQLEISDTVDSTNRQLVRRITPDAPQATVLAAELQTEGRGRRGRIWHTGLGGGLAFSVLWRFEQGVGALSGLSLAVGVAMIRALRCAGVDDAQLKWPNDVLHNYRKLAGILIEVQGDMLGPSTAVIGIGLNLQLTNATKDLIDQAVVDVRTVTGNPPQRNRLFAQLLGDLAGVLEIFEKQGFAALRDEWMAYHAYQGKPVQLLMPDGSKCEGEVSGVAEDGALLVYANGTMQRFASGEISLRPAGMNEGKP
jgi:BirA family biotin operon repressor/biotin-[acetyl-CoA-carboxylase] ligase